MSRQPRIRHWRDSDPKACLKGAKRVARLRPICTGSASKGREHLLLSYTPDSSAFLRMLVALPAHTVAMNRSDSGSGSGGAVIALLATHPRHAPALGSRLRAAHSGRAMLPLRGLEKKQVGGGAAARPGSADHVASCGVNRFAIDEARLRVGALWSPEEQDVRLGPARTARGAGENASAARAPAQRRMRPARAQGGRRAHLWMQ